MIIKREGEREREGVRVGRLGPLWYALSPEHQSSHLYCMKTIGHKPQCFHVIDVITTTFNIITAIFIIDIIVALIMILPVILPVIASFSSTQIFMHTDNKLLADQLCVFS